MWWAMAMALVTLGTLVMDWWVTGSIVMEIMAMRSMSMGGVVSMGARSMGAVSMGMVLTGIMIMGVPLGLIDAKRVVMTS